MLSSHCVSRLRHDELVVALEGGGGQILLRAVMVRWALFVDRWHHLKVRGSFFVDRGHICVYRGPALKIRGAWRVWVEVDHDPDLLLGEWQLAPPGGVLVGVAPGWGGGGGRPPGPVSAGPRGTDGLEGPDRQRVGTRTVRLGRLKIQKKL